MNKPAAFRYSVLAAISLASCLIMLLLFFLPPEANLVPYDLSIRGTDQTPIVSVSIKDLESLNYLPYVNYTPDVYLTPKTEIHGTPIDLRQNHSFAQRGTFIFVIRNLDPTDENYTEQAESLAPFLQGDSAWHFTLQIPKIWSACNIYVNYILTESIGSISDYDYMNYSDYVGKTTDHISMTEPVPLDLSFYSRRQAIYPEPLQAATVVTIHYETETNKTAGIDGIPVIGAPSAVKTLVTQNQTYVTVSYLLAAFITAILLFICLLKKERSFLPHLLISLGIFGVFLTTFQLSSSLSLPYLWNSIRAFSVAFTLLSALLTVRPKKRLSPLWTVFFVLNCIYCITVFVLCLLPLNICIWEKTFKICFILFFSAALLFFVFLYATKTDQNFPLLISPLFVGFLGISFCIPYTDISAIFHPQFWIAITALLYTVFLGGRVFIHQERKLNYLTENLQAEVQIRTRELKSIVSERDELFRYVSHDMKKPLASIENFLSVLRQREKDDEQKKTLDIIHHKINEMSRDFNELSNFSKNNFAPENSESFELNQLLERIREDYEPDCTANGIQLKILPCKLCVYGKYNSLYSVISNIVLNAIEHSGCDKIVISSWKRKNQCNLFISDNGKGISDSDNVFYPYYSQSPNKNNSGLGLYLSKSYMHSMNGDLTFKQENGLLTFIVSLPLSY